MLQQYSRTLLCDATGAATVFLGDCIRGRVVAIKYAPGTLDAGADLTIAGESSGSPILTKENAGSADVWFRPVALAHSVADGSALPDVAVEVWVYMERAKVVVAQGGAAGTGTITLWVDEE